MITRQSHHLPERTGEQGEGNDGDEETITKEVLKYYQTHGFHPPFFFIVNLE